MLSLPIHLHECLKLKPPVLMSQHQLGLTDRTLGLVPSLGTVNCDLVECTQLIL